MITLSLDELKERLAISRDLGDVDLSDELSAVIKSMEGKALLQRTTMEHRQVLDEIANTKPIVAKLLKRHNEEFYQSNSKLRMIFDAKGSSLLVEIPLN